MMGIDGAKPYLWRVIKGSRYAWQVIRAFPILLIHCVLYRKPVLYVSRHAGIGDIVCTFPSLGALKLRHPSSVVVYETGRHSMTLVRCCRHVDLVVEAGSWLAKLVPKLVKSSMVFHPLLPDEQRPPRPRERIHLIEEFRKSLGLESLSGGSVGLKVSARALQQVNQRLQREQLSGIPFVVIHTGPTWKVKEWPDQNWRELVALMKAQDLIEVIQIGEDRTSFGNEGKSPRVAGARNWVGQFTMEQTLALLSRADLFVGVDSGVLHLAGAVDTPCVGIFGPTDPICFLPRNRRTAGVTSNVSCLGCHHDTQGPSHWRNGCPNGIRCMSELSAKEVFVACNKLLKN